MPSFEDSINLAKRASPLWMGFFMTHFNTPYIASIEDDKKAQENHSGDFVVHFLSNGLTLFIEAKVRETKYLSRYEHDGCILFETVGNTNNGRLGSSFFECKADIYAYGFISDIETLRDPTLLFVKRTQKWLNMIPNLFDYYPEITTQTYGWNGVLYKTKFILIPSYHLPGYCFCPPSPLIPASTLKDLFWIDTPPYKITPS